MRIEKQTDIDRWTRPAQAGDQSEPGYDEWLTAELEAGIAELDAGQGIPAETVWKSLGIE